jgi:hypothetical protein
MNMRKLIFIAGLAVFLAACSDMNDQHDIYLKDGERIYIGKVDSLKTFAGDQRVKLRFWASDPRAKTVGFYWYPDNDSMFTEISHTSPADSFEVYIGGPSSTKTIQEGNYTLRVITRDDNNHFSVPSEKIINVYGDRFRSILTDRVLKTVAYKAADASLSLTFAGQTSDREIGVEISYTDLNGDVVAVIQANKDLTAAVKLLQVDAEKTVSYRTLFLPEPLAVDTFYTAGKTVVIP